MSKSKLNKFKLYFEMDANVMVKYSDGEKRLAKINIDRDLGGFDVKAF